MLYKILCDIGLYISFLKTKMKKIFLPNYSVNLSLLYFVELKI